MPGRGGGARRAFAQEIERFAHEFRGTIGTIEEALAALADGDGLPPGLEPDVLFAGGMPRVRPVLVLLAVEVSRKGDHDAQAAAEVAYVAELLQTAIRLHDAAFGRQDGLRRRAARRVLGGAASWLGANHVTLRALEIARRVPSPEVLGDALDALREVTEGHALAEALRGRAATSDEALRIAEGHTGAVFAFSCRAGGRVGRADRAVVTNLGRYGRHVGVAVHVAEELALVERLDPAAADGGRSPWRQLAMRPAVFPVAAAGERDPRVDGLWRRLRGAPEPAVARELFDGVRSAGGLGAARERLVLESWAARRALAPMPEGPARDALDRIAGALAKTAA